MKADIYEKCPKKHICVKKMMLKMRKCSIIFSFVCNNCLKKQNSLYAVMFLLVYIVLRCVQLSIFRNDYTKILNVNVIKNFINGLALKGLMNKQAERKKKKNCTRLEDR